MTPVGRPTVLVIEDSEPIRRGLRRALEQRGYRVVEAADGEEGLRRYRAAPTDVVLSDLMMPEKSGIELIVELRQEFPDARIVVMSGVLDLAQPAVAEVVGAAGALRMVPKPFTVDRLLEALRGVLGEAAPGESEPQ